MDSLVSHNQQYSDAFVCVACSFIYEREYCTTGRYTVDVQSTSS